MKILWLAQYPIDQLLPAFITSKPLSRGTCSWLVNLSNELSKNDYLELHILTISSSVPYSQSFSKNNIHFHIVKYNFPFTNKGFPLYLPLDRITWYAGVKKKCYAIINKISPDIIHAHGTEYVHALIGIKSGFKTIISIQGIINIIQKYDKNFSGFLQKKIEYYCVKNCKYAGYRTNFDSDFIKTVNPTAQLFYLPEAIGPYFFDYSWKNTSAESILFVGILLKRKGIEVLVSALELVKKQHPHCVLKIIGAGKPTYINYLKKLAVQSGIGNNIIWMGRKNSTQIAAELCMTSIYVLPTFIDNSPNSLAEAMAVGVPCIASDVGGIPSMIKDGYDGLLVKPNDVEDLSQKIMVLLKDKNLQDHLSAHAKETAKKRNYPQEVAKITFDVYKQLLNEQ